MATLETFFEKYILPNIILIQLIFNGRYKEQILLFDKLISNLSKSSKFLEEKYKVFEKFKNETIQSKSRQNEIFENIKNANKSYTYAKVPEELQEFLDTSTIRSKKHLEQIGTELNNLMEIVSKFINQATFIQTIIYRFQDNVFRRTKKNTSYRHFTELDKYISELSLKIRVQFQSNDEKLLTLQKKQIQHSVKEINEIHTNLNELLSLEPNNDNFETNTDIVKCLINIFDLTTIKKIIVNDKCKIVITIDNQDYLLQDIIRNCQKLEKKAAYILDQAQTFIPLVESYFNDKSCIKAHKQFYSSKKAFTITKLEDRTSDYFNNINYILNLVSPSILDNSIKAVENNADYKYFYFIYEKNKIILENYHKDYRLDLNKIQALIEICAASVKGIGLDGSGEYAFYYNYSKSKFTTLEKFMDKLSNVQNKLEECLPKTKLLLATGKQCFECSGFFNVLRQSYLKQSEDINIYTDKYRDKLEQAKLDSETNILELESKQSIIESIYNELEVMQKYGEFLNDTVYKTDSQHNYTLFTENYIQPAENISELYQNVDEIVLSNNGDGKIRLFFVSNNNKKSYFTTRQEYSCLNQSLKRLQEKAKCIYSNNKYIVQKKEEQKSIKESHKLKNKFYEFLYCFGFAALVSTFLMGFIFILKGINLLYENRNINQAEEMVSKLEIPGDK